MQDDFHQKSDAFLDWLKGFSGTSISSKIALADFRRRGAGRGVVALEDIEADEDLFTVSRASILSVENSELPSKLPDVFDNLDPWLSLILVLIHEFLRQSESSWKPYLDVLPSTFDTLMFWTDAELEELQASAVRNKIGKTEADENFKSEILPVVMQHPDLFFPNGINTLSDDELLALAHRMGSTIMAYAFDIERDESEVEVDEDGYVEDDEDEALPKGMIPLADLLNADADFNARLEPTHDGFVMRAIRPILKGEEVLNDYGPLPRSDLLRRYGYTTPNYAVYDVVEIDRNLVMDAVQRFRKPEYRYLVRLVSNLDEEGVLEDSYVIDAEEIASNFCHSLGLRLLIKTLLAGDRAFDERDTVLELEFCKVMDDVISIRSAQFTSSISEDQSLLTDATLSARVRMAIEIRLAEKQILENARQRLLRNAQAITSDGEQPPTKKQKVDVA